VLGFLCYGIPPLAAILIAIAAITGVLQYLNLRVADFALTNRRVLAKQGFIRRRSLELFLTQIESVAINQGIFGRIFDWGTLVVAGTGGTREAFNGLSAPLQFRKKLQEQVMMARKEDRR